MSLSEDSYSDQELWDGGRSGELNCDELVPLFDYIYPSSWTEDECMAHAEKSSPRWFDGEYVVCKVQFDKEIPNTIEVSTYVDYFAMYWAGKWGV